MKILLTNDDGIHAPGIKSLETVARQLSDDVTVVAPETDQSGMSHSFTLMHPLRLRQVSEKHYAVNGSPTDCVIMAVQHIMKEPPDLILSGINSGVNIANDVTYSGTIAAAMEGTLMGLRAIALSQAFTRGEDGARNLDFSVAEARGADVLRQVMDMDLPRGSFLNINFPHCPPEQVAGVRATRLGTQEHFAGIEKRFDGRGMAYFWVQSGRGKEVDTPDTDISALRSRFISVSTLKLDLTDHDTLEKLKERLG